MSIMVFVALSVAQARELRAAGRIRPDHATAATAALCQAFGYDEKTAEDADYAAQLFASLACLAAGRDRIVVSAQVREPVTVAAEAELGQIELPELNWRDVTALFTDDPDELAPIRALTRPWAGRSVADLWEDEEVRRFVEDHGLLWFDPTEFELAVGPLDTPDESES